MRWVKSADYVRTYNAINSEQPAAKANMYPLPVVLLDTSAQELFLATVEVGINWNNYPIMQPVYSDNR